MKISEFKLEEFFAKYEFSVRYLLCASDCESLTISDLLSLEKNAKNEFRKLWLGYTESQGHPDLREEITKLYKNISKDDIIVFSGAEEGIFIFVNTFLSEGDHVIVQYPAYQSLFELAHSVGCKITKWMMTHENNWELDTNFLSSSINSNTKAIILNSPHNPTGYHLSKKKFQEILDIANKNGVHVFSDEVYRFSEYDEKLLLPGACEISENNSSLGVMSKSLGLAGLRIGWIACKNKLILKKMLSFKNYTTICNSAPSEVLSILALRHKNEILRRNLGIIKNNLNLLDSFFKRYSHLFEWVKPRAGPVAFPKILLDENIEQFCLDLLKKKNVLLMPGTNFDFGEKHFRIGFGRKNMPMALDQVKKYLDKKY